MKRLAFLIVLGTLACKSEDPEPFVQPPAASPPVIVDDFEAGLPDEVFAWPAETSFVTLSTENPHSGKTSILCEVGASRTNDDPNKAMVTFEGINATEGSESWISFWLYVVETTDTRFLFFMDIESPSTCEDAVCNGISPEPCPYPGLQLSLDTKQDGSQENNITAAMGKWCSNERFEQGKKFPKDRWVWIRFYVKASATSNGALKVWQNDELVINSTGVTLPRADAAYTQFELGATGNGNTKSGQKVYIDDVEIWDKDPVWQ